MARKHAAPKFTGPLAEPIYEPICSGGILGPTLEAEANLRAMDRLMEKLSLLLEHYNIDPKDENCWFSLSVKLARDYVPGMRVFWSEPPKPGPRRTWQAGLGDDLVRAVKAAIERRPQTIKTAIKELQKSEPDKWGRYTPQSLAVRHRETIRMQRERNQRLARLLRDFGGRRLTLAELAPGFGIYGPGLLSGAGSPRGSEES